jgi:hypothetical protein
MLDGYQDLLDRPEEKATSGLERLADLLAEAVEAESEAEGELGAEPQLDALGFEALGSDDERAFDDEDEEFEFEGGDDEAEGSLEVRELDPVLLDIAEKSIAREVPLFERQVPTRWTRCFSTADIAKVEKVYQDNASAASAGPKRPNRQGRVVDVDRCSCIVMLNVALGQLLSLRLKRNPPAASQRALDLCRWGTSPPSPSRRR